jgi:hypothetical protein
MAKRGRKPAQAASTAATGETAGRRGSKSAAVREYFAHNKNAMPKEVVSSLAEKGIDVSPNMVSIIKAKMKVRRARKQAKQASANGTSTAASKGNAAGLEATMTLYKAARGVETQPARVRNAFLTLVELLG